MTSSAVRLLLLCCSSVVQVYLASSAPPVRFPNVYGVDMPNRKEFVAHGLTEDQVSDQRRKEGLVSM